eukprot:ctg_698.g350
MDSWEIQASTVEMQVSERHRGCAFGVAAPGRVRAGRGGGFVVVDGGRSVILSPLPRAKRATRARPGISRTIKLDAAPDTHPFRKARSALLTVHAFTRPHTVRGTLLASVTLSARRVGLVAAAAGAAGGGSAAVGQCVYRGSESDLRSGGRPGQQTVPAVSRRHHDARTGVGAVSGIGRPGHPDRVAHLLASHPLSVRVGHGAGCAVQRAAIPPAQCAPRRRPHHRLRARLSAQLWRVLRYARGAAAAVPVAVSDPFPGVFHERVRVCHRAHQRPARYRGRPAAPRAHVRHAGRLQAHGHPGVVDVVLGVHDGRRVRHCAGDGSTLSKVDHGGRPRVSGVVSGATCVRPPDATGAGEPPGHTRVLPRHMAALLLGIPFVCVHLGPRGMGGSVYRCG